MEHKMEIELIDAILNSMYPEKEGWTLLQGLMLEEIDLDYVFVREGEPPTVALLMECPYIHPHDVSMAKHLVDIYSETNNGQKLNIILVYKQLLVRPQRIPNGIAVISLTEDKVEEPVVCIN